MERLVSLLTTTEGEIRQRDFWSGALVLFAAGIIANLIPVVGGVLAIVLLYPWTCLALKRLRDNGRPALWAVALVLLGLVSTGASLLARIAPELAGLLHPISGLSGLLAFAFLIWLGLAPSRHSPHGRDASNPA